MLNLQPGSIIICQGANLITQLQGNTRAKHVCMVAADPRYIWTTGAKLGVFFGKVETEKYLKGKSFYICVPTHGLYDLQLSRMEEVNRAMSGQFYGFWKFFQLYGRALKEGIPKQLGKGAPAGKPIMNPICSQAVGAAYWAACIELGSREGKLDPSALTPEDIEDEMYRERLIRQVSVVEDYQP